MAEDAVRLLVRTDEGGNLGELALRAALSEHGSPEDWKVERLFPNDVVDDDLFVVRSQADASVSPRDAFTIGYELAARPGIAEVEPDLHIDQYPDLEPAPPGAFDDDGPPTPDQLAWARRAMRCDEAWAVPPAPGGTSLGAGIVIGHPDTGYTLHPVFGPGLEPLDLVRDRDFVADDGDARDPVKKGLLPLSRFPGHGTGTSSVMVGRGTRPDELVGLSPQATVVPLRAVNTVIQLFDSDVARAVNHARESGCHVLSMSLGGKGFFGLRRAIDRAVDAGMIVLAAAGNYVRLVTAPASYENCIAVAATGPDDAPWAHSSRGRDVEISAPGAGCYGAAWNLASMTPFLSTKAGTSYAVAHTAAAAALWLGHHGREDLRDRYPGGLLQAAFRRLLRDHAHRVPDIPAGWDPSRYGPGILEIHALLTAPLPEPGTLAAPGAFADSPAPVTGIARIAASFGELDEPAVRERLEVAGLIGESVDATAAELLYLLFTDRRAAASFEETPPGAAGAFGLPWVDHLRHSASPRLNAAIG